MTHHSDAYREGTGAAVERSRSYPDGTKALTPPSVSRPVSPEEWKRLARAATEMADEWPTEESLREGFVDEWAAFIAHCSPERILGLIGEVRRWRTIRPHLFVDGDATDHTTPDSWAGVFLKEEHPLYVKGTTFATVEQIIDGAAPEERDDA
jgi:hypothetical protein